MKNIVHHKYSGDYEGNCEECEDRVGVLWSVGISHIYFYPSWFALLIFHCFSHRHHFSETGQGGRPPSRFKLWNDYGLIVFSASPLYKFLCFHVPAIKILWSLNCESCCWTRCCLRPILCHHHIPSPPQLTPHSHHNSPPSPPQLIPNPHHIST